MAPLGRVRNQDQIAVLGKRAILERLSRLEHGEASIFSAGTWDEESLRAAAYDLRVACDWLITPDGTRYWPSGSRGHQERKAPFKLEPGEVAFVSSVEDLRMPDDLAGNIAPRFRRALEGILVMGGMLVDPGYRGRLHFQLANIGDDAFELIPGETSVAAIQFLPVAMPAPSHGEAPNSEDLLNRLFFEEASEPLPQLAFFSRVGDLQDDLKAVERRVEDQKMVLDSTKRSTDQLLVFGVFLVSITLFAVAIGVIIDAFAGAKVKDAAASVQGADLTVPGIAVAVALLAVVGLATFFMMKPVAAIARAHRGEKSAEDSGKSG